MNTYRPISLLPAISKILEKVIKERLLGFLKGSGVFTWYQYGFLKKEGVQNAVFDIIVRLQSALDRKKTAGLFLDFRKAFDSLDHCVLLQKLSLAGIRGVALDSFRSYLSGRTRFVVNGGQESSIREIVCGVPQGRS